MTCPIITQTKELNWDAQNECINNKYLQKSSWTCFRISPRKRGGKVKARSEMLKRVQHDHPLWAVI